MQLFQLLFAHLNRRKVGVREITIIVCILFTAHGRCFSGFFIKSSGLLDDLFAVFNRFHLAAVFKLNRLLYILEGVQVLHLSTGAKRLTRFVHRQVDIAPQRAFLHPAIGNTSIQDGCTEFLQVGDCFFSRADIRFRYNLNQRNAAAVAVDKGTALIMDQFSGVFLNVNAGNANALGAGRGFNIQVSMFTQRQIILGNLIGFRQIGVKVVFPVLLGITCNRTVGRHAGLDRVFYNLAVEDRKRAGQTHADRADMSVGFCAEVGRAAAKNFGPGFQLDMNFQTDDHFIFRSKCRHLDSFLSDRYLEVVSQFVS